MEDSNSKTEITCERCGATLTVNKQTFNHKCPVCGFLNDAQKRMETMQIQREGRIDAIKYESNSESLVWKYPVSDYSFTTQLIVHEGQEAVVYKENEEKVYKTGQYYIVGEDNYGNSLFPTAMLKTTHLEIYFVNLTVIAGIKWGTDQKIRMFDPASGMYVEIGASGAFSIRVSDSKKLLERLAGNSSALKQDELIGLGDGKNYFRAMIMTQVKSCFAQTVKANNINILELDEKLALLSEVLKERLNGYLAEYGLQMPEFFVSRIVYPDDDVNFRRMKAQYAEQYLLVKQEEIRHKEAEAALKRKELEAKTAARLKVINAMGDAGVKKILAEADAVSYKLKAEAEAAEIKYKQEAMKTAQSEEANFNPEKIMSEIESDIETDVMSDALPFENKPQLEILPNSCSWDCSCGAKGITGNFCSNCGAKKPVMQTTWDCSCGMKGITGNFCSNCGAKRPVLQTTWDCKCGNKGITGNFCSNCGQKRM